MSREKSPKAPKVHISVELCEENYKQLLRIAETYYQPRASIIAQAIAKWYYTDPAVKKEAPDGASHS